MTAPKPRCDTCRYWSELIAKASGTGPLRALCLSQRSYQSGCFTASSSNCAAYSRGTPIDTPSIRSTAA